MRKLFCALFLYLWWVAGFSQPLSLFSYEGEVRLKDPSGVERAKELNMPINLNDMVTISPGASLSIYDQGKPTVLVFGECSERPVNTLLQNRKSHFWGRVRNILDGSNASNRAYVSYKGDNPLPEFLYAAHADAYVSAYRIDLQVIDDSTGQEVRQTMTEGQPVHFRVVNHEDFPLCIGIVWQNAAGDVDICLDVEKEVRYCLVPAEGTLDLTRYPMVVEPPLGRDRIFLFASQEFFDLREFPERNAAYRPGEHPGIPIGFVRKEFRTR